MSTFSVRVVCFDAASTIGQDFDKSLTLPNFKELYKEVLEEVIEKEHHELGMREINKIYPKIAKSIQVIMIEWMQRMWKKEQRKLSVEELDKEIYTKYVEFYSLTQASRRITIPKATINKK